MLEIVCHFHSSSFLNYIMKDFVDKTLFRDVDIPKNYQQIFSFILCICESLRFVTVIVLHILLVLVFR